MKKYTNKILIIAAAAFLAAFTILFFIKATEIKKEINEQNRSTELTINY
jgi:hypothetical protein